MKKLLLIFVSAFCTLSFSKAQNTFYCEVHDSSDHAALTGAAVILKGTTNGAYSDSTGHAILQNIPNGEQIFEVHYTGYRTKEIHFTFPRLLRDPYVILLAADQSQLEEVVISTTRTGSRIEDAPVKIEVLGMEELKEENGIKPGNVTSLLGDISSVTIQQTSPATGESDLRMMGLDGHYTLQLRDGMPAFGGLSGGFSMLQIPPLDLKQIELIKGPSSTLNGGGAIAGLVNFISKEPCDSSEASFTLNESSLFETNINTYFSGTKKKTGYTLFGGYTGAPAKDVNDDGFTDVPAVQQLMIHPQWFYKFNPHDKMRIGIMAQNENRTGGDLLAVQNQKDSVHAYFDDARSTRTGADFQFSHRLKGKKEFSVKANWNQFRLHEQTNSIDFSGTQWNGYTEIFYSVTKGKSNFVLGGNYVFEAFQKTGNDTFDISDYKHHTEGAFLQYELNVPNKINIEAGIRADHVVNDFLPLFETHNTKQWMILPSVAMLVHATKYLSFRVNAGSGYRMPNEFDFIDISRIGGQYIWWEWPPYNSHVTVYPLADNIRAVTSLGGTFEWNYKKNFGDESSLFINQTLFITSLRHEPYLSGNWEEFCACYPTSGYIYLNSENKKLMSGIDNYIRLKIKSYEIYLGYTYTDSPSGASPVHRASTTVVKEFGERWRFGIEASYNSFANGFLYRERNSYLIGAASIMYKTGAFTFVLNGENLGNIRQSNWENIVSGIKQHPLFAELYAPIDGRVINASVKISF